MKLYKIRDRNTGMYSTGGMNPGWTKRGKTWNAFNHLKTHLRQFCGEYIFKNNIPENWEVVEIEYTEQETNNYLAKDLYPKTETI